PARSQCRKQQDCCRACTRAASLERQLRCALSSRANRCGTRTAAKPSSRCILRRLHAARVAPLPPCSTTRSPQRPARALPPHRSMSSKSSVLHRKLSSLQASRLPISFSSQTLQAHGKHWRPHRFCPPPKQELNRAAANSTLTRPHPTARL